MSKVAGQQGFTLVEVLIAVTLFAIGMIAVSGLTLSSIRGNSLSAQINQANSLAKSKLEELHCAKPSDLADGSEADIDATGTTGGIFDRVWEVTAGPTANSRRVVVRVTWRRGGPEHRVVLETVVRGNTNG